MLAIPWASLARSFLPWVRKLLAGIAVFFIGRKVTRIVVRGVGPVARRAGMDRTLVNFVEQLIDVALLIVITTISLSLLGVNMTAAVAVLGGLALSVGLSLQGQLSSLATGIMLTVTRPFSVGDVIEAGGSRGVVEAIGILNTTLRTPDNQTAIMPNAIAWGSTIINYSDRPTRRIDLTIGVSYDADLRTVRTVLENVIAADERILRDPAPLIAVRELAASSVNFVLHPWVKNADYRAVLFALNEKIKLALDEANISIPYPQVEVHLRQRA